MQKLTIASYNIHKCVGIDKKFDPCRIIRVIKELDATILALQETDKRFGKRVGLLDIDHLKQETQCSYIPIRAMSAHGLGWHGNALFIKEGRVLDLMQIKLPGVEPRGALMVEIAFSSGNLRIIAAHFGLLRYSRRQQVQTIISLLKQRSLMPTLMLGDLNEWRIGRKSSLKNFETIFDMSIAALPSYPARFPIFALDRVFSFPSTLIKNIEIHASPLARMASDHLPIKAYLDLNAAHETVRQLNMHAVYIKKNEQTSFL